MQMRHKLNLLLIAVLLTVLAACGGQETATEPAALEPTAPPAELPEATGQPLPPPIVENEILPTPTLAPPVEAPQEVEPTAEPEVSGPFPADQFGYGIQIHGNATVGNPTDTMVAVHDQLGMNWVKAQIQWWLVEPDPAGEDQWFFYDAVIDEAHNKGLRLALSVVGAPEWTRAAGGESTSAGRPQAQPSRHHNSATASCDSSSQASQACGWRGTRCSVAGVVIAA